MERRKPERRVLIRKNQTASLRNICRDYWNSGLGIRFNRDYWAYLTSYYEDDYRSDHRYLIPGEICCGGFLLLCVDTVTRTWLGNLPVGIVTAFFGAPFFLMLMRRRTDL